MRKREGEEAKIMMTTLLKRKKDIFILLNGDRRTYLKSRERERKKRNSTKV